MPNQSRIVPFPMGGVARRLSFGEQPPRTAYDALNIWPAQPSTGRLRGGTRPSLVSAGVGSGIGGEPYHSCDIAWKSTGSGHTSFVNRATAVVCDQGTKTTADGSAWTTRIATTPNSDFCSVAAFQQVLFQASIGRQKIYFYDLGASSGGNLTDDSATAFPGRTWAPPEYAGVVCAWGGRLLVAGIKDEPHVLRGSKIGDYLDWDESAVDDDASFSLSGAGNSVINEAILVVFSHNRDCCLVGGPNSCYMLRGNPSAGTGGPYGLSTGIGPLMMSAICKADGASYFLSRVGPYFIPEGCGQAPIPVGGEQIPNDLIGVDPGNGDWASVAFDERWRLVHWYVNRASGTDAYWVYSVDHKSWWPMEFNATIQLGISIPGVASDDVGSCLAMTVGGATSKFDRSDTSESIDSYFDVGPIPLGGPNEVGILTALNATLAEDSADVDYEIYVGDSEQEAMNATTPLATGTFTRQGYNIERRPRLRGKAARIRCLAGAGSDRISIENLLPTTAVVARQRAE